MNIKQLSEVFNRRIQSCVDDTAEELYDKLLDYIVEEAYDESRNRTGDNEIYERSYQFLNSWKVKHRINLGDGRTRSQIYHDFTTLIYNAELFQHGNKDKPLVGTSLAEILNDGASNGNNPFGFPETTATHFWDDYIKWVNENIDDIFAKHCKLKGIPVHVTATNQRGVMR